MRSVLSIMRTMDNKQPHIEHVQWPSVENGGLVRERPGGSYVNQHYLERRRARAAGRAVDPSRLSYYAGAWTHEIEGALQCFGTTLQYIIPLGAIAAALEVTLDRLHELYISAPRDWTDDIESFFEVHSFKLTFDVQRRRLVSHGQGIVFVDFHEWEAFISWAQRCEGTQENAASLLREAMFPND